MRIGELSVMKMRERRRFSSRQEIRWKFRERTILELVINILKQKYQCLDTYTGNIDI